MKDFLPIILGSDSNVYGVAKSFHKEYNINSIAVAGKALYDTKHSKIVEVLIYNDIQTNFVNILTDLFNKYKKEYKNIILISCSDGYTELILKHKKKLSDMFILPYINLTLKEKLENKEEFYEMCEKYELDYPQTLVINNKNYKTTKIKFKYPIIIKASNSISYYETSFEGKKKAYKIESEEEAKDVLNKIYNSSYQDKIIIQEYIPSDDTSMHVLNSYSNKDGKVKMMTLGNVIMEDHAPSFIGNFNAIKTVYNKDVYDKIKTFLEEINYVGYSNFDMKYDYRDNKYKLLEINIRQGRSSYFVTAAGNNLAKFIVDDYIYNKNHKIIYNDSKSFWSYIPKCLVYKYISTEEKNNLKKLSKQGKYEQSLFYMKDLSLKRILTILKVWLIQYKWHKKYYKKEEFNV